jgi:hypothetical protein
MMAGAARFRCPTALLVTIVAFAYFTVLLSAAAADDLSELRVLGFDFPSEINDFTRGDIIDNELKHPGLGYTIAYHGPQAGEEATVYVYDLGIRNIPDGPLNTAARQAFDQAAGDVLATEGYPGLGRVKVSMVDQYVANSGAGEAQFLCAEFVFQMADGSAQRSYLYLTGARSKFLKIRTTLPTSDATITTAREFADTAASMLIVSKRP